MASRALAKSNANVIYADVKTTSGTYSK